MAEAAERIGLAETVILALDPSTTHIGYAIFNGQEYVVSGCFVPKGDRSARFASVVRWAEAAARPSGDDSAG